MKRIGILGGCSDQMTVEYYRRINAAVNARLGGFHTAEILINSMDFALAESCVHAERWDELADYLNMRASCLEAAGADILICVSNTLHRVAPVFTGGLSIPLLHIADPTGAAVRDAGLGRVGLLGTKPTMSGDHMRRRYRERFGFEIITPPPAEQDRQDTIIFQELCRGIVTPRSRAIYLAAIDDLRARGAEGVILGCTELSLIVGQEDRPDFPLFDSCQLHVEAVVEMAFSED